MNVTRFTLSAALICACASIAGATPVDDMQKQGFVCESNKHGKVICAKDGAPTKICDAAGSCFRIVYQGTALENDQMMTGSVTGFGNRGGLKNANTEY